MLILIKMLTFRLRLNAWYNKIRMSQNGLFCKNLAFKKNRLRKMKNFITNQYKWGFKMKNWSKFKKIRADNKCKVWFNNFEYFDTLAALF